MKIIERLIKFFADSNHASRAPEAWTLSVRTRLTFNAYDDFHLIAVAELGHGDFDLASRLNYGSSMKLGLHGVHCTHFSMRIPMGLIRQSRLCSSAQMSQRARFLRPLRGGKVVPHAHHGLRSSCSLLGRIRHPWQLSSAPAGGRTMQLETQVRRVPYDAIHAIR